MSFYEKFNSVFAKLFKKQSAYYQIKSAGICSKDEVLEIGTGRGIITEVLSNYSKKVVSYEIDKKLFDEAKLKLEKRDNVKIIHADFLKQRLDLQKFKLFANIPFILTTEIIKKITNYKNAPSESFVIMQKEAAKRFCLGNENTQFAILLNPWFEFKIMHYFKKTDFLLIPSVTAVLVKISRRKNALISNKDAQLFKDFVVFLFNFHGSTLKKSLQKIFTFNQVRKIFQNQKIDSNLTPSKLNFNTWLNLFESFKKFAKIENKVKVIGAELKLRRQQKRLKKRHRSTIKENSKKSK